MSLRPSTKVAVIGATLLVLMAGLFFGLRPPTTSGPLHITGVLHVNINVSDFNRSRAFYEQLGFRVLMEVDPDGSGQIADAVGMDTYTVRGALMVHDSGAVIDLLEWQDPRLDDQPYEQLNHLGLARLALTTTDLDADMARLQADGVEFVSSAPGELPDPFGGTTRFICFKDPDGTTLELVEMGPVMDRVRRASRVLSERRREGLH